MSTTLTHTANEIPVPEGTLVDLLFEGVKRHGERTALEYVRRPGELEGHSYQEVLAKAKNVAASLEVHGVTRCDRAAILEVPCLWLARFDFAAGRMGCTPPHSDSGREGYRNLADRHQP